MFDFNNYLVVRLLRLILAVFAETFFKEPRYRALNIACIIFRCCIITIKLCVAFLLLINFEISFESAPKIFLTKFHVNHLSHLKFVLLLVGLTYQTLSLSE